jgi:hypothetical protein
MDALQSPLTVNGSHSAAVQMWLHIGNQSLPVVQAGDRALKLRDHVMLPTGPASLEVVVDGQSRHSAITVLSNDNSRWIKISHAISN